MTTCVPKKVSPKSQVPSIWRLLYDFCRQVCIHSVRSGLGSRLQIWFTSCRRCIASSCFGKNTGGTESSKTPKNSEGFKIREMLGRYTLTSLVHLQAAETVRVQTICDKPMFCISKRSLISTETRLSSFGNATHFLWMHLLFPSLVSYKGKSTSSWHHYRPGCSCSDQPWTPKCLKVIRLKCGGGNSSKMKHGWLCLIQVISICDHQKNPARTCFLAWGDF